MKVTGELTHARFTAELARIARICSKQIAHESLRMHTGDFAAQGIVDQNEVDALLSEIGNIIENIRAK